jgi:hypothetical protein
MEIPNLPNQPIVPPQVVKKFNFSKPQISSKMLIVIVVVIFVGIGAGWLLSNGRQSSSSKVIGAVTTTSDGKKEVGISDTETFRDSAEGVLREGGIEGEGAYHLERPGGDSQNVYLTSTVVDLGSFVGKKVEVWGQTVSAKVAGWLMDVGKVKILE